MEVIHYWRGRVTEAKHPVLRARYAGLVWDFSQPIGNEKPNINMAHARIDAIVEIATRNLHKYETQTIKMLAHALRMACQINDPLRVEAVRDAILAFEDQVGEDDKVGLWVFSYDLLWKKKKVPLTDEQQMAIIKRLEDRLARLTDGNTHDPWGAEAAAVRLAEHYRTIGSLEDVHRVLLLYGGAFEKLSEQAAPMLAQAWLEDVSAKYRAFGLSDDADRILHEVHELGPKVSASLKPIAIETTIKKVDMDNHVNAMLDGSLQDALARIVGAYIPQRDALVKEINNLAKKHRSWRWFERRSWTIVVGPLHLSILWMLTWRGMLLDI